MPRYLRLAAATLCCVGVAQARAQMQSFQPNTTGNEFYSMCTPKEEAQYLACTYYVIGYTDGLNMLNAVLKGAGKQPLFCMPSNGGKSVLGKITGVQSTDIIMNFLQRNPQRRHELTAVLIVEAFKEAFPCS
jgi:hypothetical protein